MKNSIIRAVKLAWGVPYYRTIPPESYPELLWFGFAPRTCVLILQWMIVNQRFGKVTIRNGIKHMLLVDRSDACRLLMVGTKSLGSYCFHAYYDEDRHGLQRWHRKTEEGRTLHLSGIYVAISISPEEFLNMLNWDKL